MLKMYHQYGQEAGSPEFWEEVWSDVAFEEALRFCAVDPLRPLFERYAEPGVTLLEGGCGRGQYVAYYSARGVKVVGLDFACETLTELRERDRNLVLCAGDVARLPFSDESFDVYYSGGVVEHFEAGSGPALREAWRVLRPGGVLLVSVPYFSPLRRAVSLVKVGDRRRVPVEAVDAPAERNGRQFFQYAYTPREFKQLLGAAGFSVISTQGYSIIWGLYELPLTSRVMSALERRRKAPQHTAAVLETGDTKATSTGHNHNGAAQASLLKRLVISEDDSVPVAGSIVRALRWTCANMMMYICRREQRRSVV